MGVLEPVQHSEWGAPIVPVLKSDGNVRICGNFKLTANKAVRVDKYPLPRIEEIFGRLSGGKIFSKLDLSQAYQQVVVDDACRDVLTINIHLGLHRYRRLAFGVNSAVALFQREIIQRGPLPKSSTTGDSGGDISTSCVLPLGCRLGKSASPCRPRLLAATQCCPLSPWFATQCCRLSLRLWSRGASGRPRPRRRVHRRLRLLIRVLQCL